MKQIKMMRVEILTDKTLGDFDISIGIGGIAKEFLEQHPECNADMSQALSACLQRAADSVREGIDIEGATKGDDT
ncbi:MAG: hypothetical protein AAFW84_19990 [Cyanobacteria bacterium J06635_15]